MTPTILQTDFYKLGHPYQYPKDVTQVFSNWTPRASRIPSIQNVNHLGMGYFIQRFLIEEFNQTFFGTSLQTVIGDVREVMESCLGVKSPDLGHIEKLHRLGYLPIKIWSIPEGESVPIGVPSMVITNTHPDAFWVPNYLETILSATIWKPSTTCTIAREYRRICEHWADEARETDKSFIDYQCHDFSMRGMSGAEDAALSGLGHLMSFRGTDSIPAILLAAWYYGTKDLSIGQSVPATEHSVMCAGGKSDELETFRRLIEDLYPNGIVSVVSDTWDLWTVLTSHIPNLKDKILKRDGKLVIRPDSGDPVLITLGDPSATGAAKEGVLRLLAQALGVEERGGKLPLINRAGEIYGDSITLDRCDRILGGIVNELGLSPYNMVFGVGSYTYQYQTRDTFGFAMKATAVRRGDEIVPIFKDPFTDSGGCKKSAYGIPCVYGHNGNYTLKQDCQPGDLNNCSYEVIFENGQHLHQSSFYEISDRVRRIY